LSIMNVVEFLELEWSIVLDGNWAVKRSAVECFTSYQTRFIDALPPAGTNSRNCRKYFYFSMG